LERSTAEKPLQALLCCLCGDFSGGIRFGLQARIGASAVNQLNAASDGWKAGLCRLQQLPEMS
jgi:hypothetical protein